MSDGTVVFLDLVVRMRLTPSASWTEPVLMMSSRCLYLGLQEDCARVAANSFAQTASSGEEAARSVALIILSDVCDSLQSQQTGVVVQAALQLLIAVVQHAPRLLDQVLQRLAALLPTLLVASQVSTNLLSRAFRFALTHS